MSQSSGGGEQEDTATASCEDKTNQIPETNKEVQDSEESEVFCQNQPTSQALQKIVPELNCGNMMLGAAVMQGSGGGSDTRKKSTFYVEQPLTNGNGHQPVVMVNGFKSSSESEDTISVTMREFKSDTYPRRRSASMAEVKEQATTRLQEELKKAQEELKLKDEECERLCQVRDQMGRELEELTASLFEEANNMVQDANIKRMHSEKLLKEANTKIEVLQAEVEALKALVITSTPSMPNKHLHPQIDKKKQDGSSSPKFFVKGHRRSTSHHEIMSEIKKTEVPPPVITQKPEIDSVYFEEFRTWKATSNQSPSAPFLARIQTEDTIPCLNFPNKELSAKLLETVANNTLTIEPIPGNLQGNGNIPRECALTKAQRVCKYRLKCGDQSSWHFVSECARDRIAAVCDFYTYVRYIQQGLVKSDEQDMYLHIMNLRKNMSMARLGFKS